MNRKLLRRTLLAFAALALGGLAGCNTLSGAFNGLAQDIDGMSRGMAENRLDR